MATGTCGTALAGVLALLGMQGLAATPAAANGHDGPAIDPRRAAAEVYAAKSARDGQWLDRFAVPKGCNHDVYAMQPMPDGSVVLGGAFSACGSVGERGLVRYRPATNQFESMGANMNGSVFALALHNGDLIIGGAFNRIGGVNLIGIARYDGSQYSEVGGGTVGVVGDGSVLALLSHGGQLYAGGTFVSIDSTPVQYVARWDGNFWNAMGTGTDNTVWALEGGAGSEVYVGGEFTTVNGSAIRRIARWDSSSWHPLGTPPNDGASNNAVRGMLFSGGLLYVGGTFGDLGPAGGPAKSGAGVWNGSSWSGLGTGLNSGAAAVIDYGGNPVFSGSFTTAGGVSASGVARWNGTGWEAFGSGVQPTAFAMAVQGTDLYVGGAGALAEGNQASHVARWDGGGWNTLGPSSGIGLNGRVNAVAVDGSNVYVAGDFEYAGTTLVNRIARWDGNSWHPLSTGLNQGAATALWAGAGVVYVGGGFSSAGGVPANRIARWDGATWQAMGTGFSGGSDVVRSILKQDGVVYVGGDFSLAGGVTALNLAQWDGSLWSAVGGGTSGPVFSIVPDGGSGLYVGGVFGTVDPAGSPLVVNNIAHRSASSWSALGSGTNDTVRAIAIDGSTLYAAGAFSSAGGTAASGVASWNGATWSALGSGVNGLPEALAILDGQLVLGGNPSLAGGQPVNRVALWDGSRWSPLGPAADNGGNHHVVGFANAACAGCGLYAVGLFGRLGGATAAGFGRFVPAVADTGRQVVAVAPAANADSISPVSSATGRYVVFRSEANNLVDGDGNGSADIFRTDTQTGVTELVSRDDDEGAILGDSVEPSVSADGELVLFVAPESAVMKFAGESSKAAERRRKGGGFAVVLRNMLTGTTQRIGSAAGSGSGSTPVISPDGSRVVYTRENSDPGMGAMNQMNVFSKPLARDGLNIQIGAEACLSCQQVSVAGIPTGTPADAGSGRAVLSADGTMVAYETLAKNLVGGQTSPCGPTVSTIMLRNVLTGVTRQVSPPLNQPPANCGSTGSSAPTIDYSGLRIGFAADQPLKPADLNGLGDIYVASLLPGGALTGYTRVSERSDGSDGNGASGEPALSGDGSTLAWISGATNLDPGFADANALDDVHVRRLDGATVNRLSLATSGAQANAAARRPAMNYNANLLLFDSTADNLAPGADGAQAKVFLRTLGLNAEVVFAAGFD